MRPFGTLRGSGSLDVGGRREAVRYVIGVSRRPDDHRPTLGSVWGALAALQEASAIQRTVLSLNGGAKVVVRVSPPTSLGYSDIQVVEAVR